MVFAPILDALLSWVEAKGFRPLFSIVGSSVFRTERTAAIVTESRPRGWVPKALWPATVLATLLDLFDFGLRLLCRPFDRRLELLRGPFDRGLGVLQGLFGRELVGRGLGVGDPGTGGL